MHETGPRGDPGSLAGAIAAHPNEGTLDDWLGEISDDDWSERATDISERRRPRPAQRDQVPEEGFRRDPTAALPAGPIAATTAHHAIVHRRRLVAGLAFVVVLALAGLISVLLLRSQGRPPATPAPDGSSSTPARTETRPSSAPTTPVTAPTTTSPPSAPAARGASAFILPEGTKLQRGEVDPAAISDLEAITNPEVVTDLQQALSAAGYEPGPPDGTFGPRTEAAVIAFQQANGLSADGIVGPETASALNRVVANG